VSYAMKITSAVFSMLLFAVPVAQAGDSPQDIKARIGSGNPAAGKDKSAMCQGCHGADGNSPAPGFPKLSGQFADYLRKQILDFQSGARVDPVMSGMAAALTDSTDLHDISAYFASQKQMKGAAGKSEAGEKLYREGDAARGIYGCVNCHGENGKGLAADNALFPVIGGQHKEYLVKQITDLKMGNRKNDPGSMMANVAKGLTSAEIDALAEYLAGK
jgi:cytochrome c553